MRRPTVLLSCALALAAGAARAQEPAPVVLDGVFDEWAGTPFAAIAAPRHGSPGQGHPYGADSLAQYARVSGVAVRHDAEGVYLRLRLEKDVSLQGLDGALLLLLDADGDTATGWAEHGMRGVDAVVEFSPPVGASGENAGVGLRTRSRAGDAPSLVSPYQAGVMVAPSRAAREFEMRIGRGGAVRFGTRMSARLVTLDRGAGVVDALTPFTVSLADPAPRPTPPGAGAADPLARAPGTDFRVVSWNVGRQDLFTRPDGFGAVLRPLAPDLLVLDEVAGGHSADEVEALLNRILPGAVSWRAVYGVSGGSQRGVIAVRGAAPRLVAPFDAPLPYPDSAAALAPADASPDLQRWLRSRLDSHVPATGALVRIGGRTLLVVTMDLESGGAPGSARDRLRLMEANAVRDATERALHAAVPADDLAGLLVAGDVNLVGSREPLDVLLRPACGGPALEVARPLRLDGGSTATWEDPAQPFTPSLLDYVLHHPPFTAVAGGFVFRAADLSPEWRARHGLREESSRVTDHLPVVTDLRWVDPAR